MKYIYIILCFCVTGKHTIVCHETYVPVQHTIVYHKKRPAVFKHYSSFIFLLPYEFLFVCFFHHASQPFPHYPAVNLTHQATPVCSLYRGISNYLNFSPLCGVLDSFIAHGNSYEKTLQSKFNKQFH